MATSGLEETALATSPPVGGRAGFLGLERNVLAISVVVFVLGMGEELWKKFFPKYMEALGAGPAAIGLFGTAKDFLDAGYQYPGGWLADHLGRRRAFLLFIFLASLGYLIYLLSPSWPYIFLGLAFTMVWYSMAPPAIFAMIGDALPRERRAMGFTLQSIFRRVPMAIAPLISGALIASVGIVKGVHAGLLVTLFFAGLTASIVWAMKVPVLATGAPLGIRGVWRSFHGALKRLLISDVFIRFCEGLTEIFVILYVTNVAGLSIAEYGVLLAIQMSTSILVCLPAGTIADRVGRKPFVVVTFACFALFPLAIVAARGFGWLAGAFVIGGLREIGEPSRKAMIVDLAEPHCRARSVGLYYLVRSLAVTPAAAIGGLLWQLAPQTPFFVAGLTGLVGIIVFILTVEEQHAG